MGAGFTVDFPFNGVKSHPTLISMNIFINRSIHSNMGSLTEGH